MLKPECRWINHSALKDARVYRNIVAWMTSRCWLRGWIWRSNDTDWCRTFSLLIQLKMYGMEDIIANSYANECKFLFMTFMAAILGGWKPNWFNYPHDLQLDSDLIRLPMLIANSALDSPLSDSSHNDDVHVLGAFDEVLRPSAQLTPFNE